MKQSRKRVTIVVTALVAVAALVFAATALAGVWKKEGKELKEKTTFVMTGGEVIEIESGASVMLCNSTLTLETSGGSTASITGYSIEKSSCTGLAGKLSGCTVTTATPRTLPYSVTVGTTTLTAKGFGATYTMNTGCTIKSIEASYSELTLTPETATEIKSFHFGATATGKVNGASAAVSDGGSWSLSAAQSGKYGIG